MYMVFIIYYIHRLMNEYKILIFVYISDRMMYDFNFHYLL